MQNILLTAYYYKPHFGGIENSLYHISQSYKNNGDEPILLVSDADVTKWKRLPGEEIVDGVHVFRFRRFLPFFRFFIFLSPIVEIYRCSRLIKKINRKYEFNFSVCRNYITGLGCVKAGLANNYYIIPGVVIKQDMYNSHSFLSFHIKNLFLRVYNNLILIKTQHYLQKQFAKSCSHIFALSNNMKTQIITFLKVDEQKITVRFPGVYVPDYGGPLIPRTGNFRFLIVSRITGMKRVDLAIEAMKLLQNQPCELYIVGEGPVKSDLQHLVAKSQLSEKVFFCGYTPDVGPFYQSADCFILPSEYEPFGQTVLEAMSFGLPVMAFRADGKKVITASAEIVENGINGILVEEFSAKALAAQMSEMMNAAPETLAKYSHNNKILSENYTWNSFNQQIVDKYKVDCRTKVLLTAFYYKPHFGGVENSLYHLSRVINKHNTAVIVVSDADLSKKKRLQSYSLEDNIEVYRFKRFLPALKIFMFLAPIIDVYRCAKKVREINRQFNFSFSISRSHTSGLGCIRAGIDKNFYIIPSIVSQLDVYTKSSFLSLNLKNKLLIIYNNLILIKIQDHIQKRFANKASHIFTLSSNMKQQVVTHLHVAEERVSVHFPGVFVPDYGKAPAADNNHFKFLIVGRLTGVKRIDLAISAIQALNMPMCQLHVVGDGPLKQDLQHLAIELDVASSIVFHDFTSDVGYFYKSADCFIMSSEYEAFGQTILEAMSFGLPVIAFRPDGIVVKTASNEIVEDNVNGLLINDFNANALATGMAKLVNDEQARRLYRTNNLEKSNLYTWESFTDNIFDIYAQN